MNHNALPGSPGVPVPSRLGGRGASHDRTGLKGDKEGGFNGNSTSANSSQVLVQSLSLYYVSHHVTRSGNNGLLNPDFISVKK